MSAMITTQKKFLKLGKIGPNILKVVSAPTTNTETNLAHLEVLLTQSVYLPTKGLETDYYDSLTISYTR